MEILHLRRRGNEHAVAGIANDLPRKAGMARRSRDALAAIPGQSLESARIEIAGWCGETIMNKAIFIGACPGLTKPRFVRTK